MRIDVFEDSLTITKIPFKFTGGIYRSPMPFSLYDRDGKIWDSYLHLGISMVVILVELHEYQVHGKKDLPDFYRSYGMDVLHFPIQDFQTPTDIDFMENSLQLVSKSARKGIDIAVHCMAGVGRTGLFLACLGKRHFGYDGYEAMEWIRSFIPDAIESKAQEKFLLGF